MSDSAPTERRLGLNTGLSYRILEWNPSAKARGTVLLVHGFLDNAYGWQAMVEAGAGRDLHVIAPDMRGHGKSDRVGAGGYYYFLDYVADLASVVDQLASDTLFLVGHSMGGAIAAYYAGTFTSRVSRLAILEGTGPADEAASAGPERVAAWIRGQAKARRRAPTAYRSVEAAAQRLRQVDTLLDASQALRLAEHGTTEVDGQRVFDHDPLHLTRGPYPFRLDFAERFWAAIDCPTLLVDAELSTLRHDADEADRRRACFRHATTATIQSAGHMMQRHQPLGLWTCLERFFNS